MKNNTENFDVIVIGGGPSGMMAAGGAANRGKKVLLLERNRDLGRKLKITGGGRCNITNAEYDIHKFLENYDEASKFLHSSFSQFSVEDTFKFFESRSLPLVVESRNRVFPKSQSARDVFRVMRKYVDEAGVTVKTNTKVERLIVKGGEIMGVATSGEEFFANSFVLATGGLSSPDTGSTGDGLRWTKRLGHKVKKPNPDIVPLRVKNQWIKKNAGTTLSFMRITFYLDGKKQFSKTGKILFTHFGLSGPLILNSSNKVKNLLSKGAVTASIDAFPDTNLGLLEKRIIKVFNANKNKDLKNIAKEIAPLGMDKALVKIIKIDSKIHSVTKEQRKEIVRLLKAFPVDIAGLMGFDRAVVSDGGVILEEVNTKTMQSRIHKNLYFTGDLLNITRPSGGFSLQLCWTTGFIAGKNA